VVEMIALLLAAQAEQKTALVLLDVPTEIAVVARTKLVGKLAAANHPVASLEETRALFADQKVDQLGVSKLETIRTTAGLAKLILIDSAVAPRDGQAVYRIRVFKGDEPQLRFQATKGDDANVLTESVMTLIEDFSKGRSAAH
jgi:hypothetical protein